MPRSEICLGVIGSGKVEKRNAYALLRDLIDASGGHARFVLPLTQTYWNPSMQVVSDFARDNSIPVEAIVDDSTLKMRELKPLLAGCAKTHQSGALPHKMSVLLDEAHTANLLVLWNDEDEDALDVVRAVDEKGITLLELTRGLDRIELVAEDEDEEAPAPEQPAPDFEEPVPDVVVEEPEPEEEDEPEPVAEEALEEDDEVEVEEEEEFPEPEAADDLDEDEEPEEEEFYAEEDEVFEPPADDEDDTALLEELEAPLTMTDFQEQLIRVLEGATAALLSTLDIVTAQLGGQADAVAATLQNVEKAVKSGKTKVAKPVQQELPVDPEPAPVVRRVMKKATPGAVNAPVAPAPAPSSAPKASSNGRMTREQAQAVMDAYRPRRGRPPAEVVQARKLLGLV